MALKGILHPLYVYPQVWNPAANRNDSNWPSTVKSIGAKLAPTQEHIVIMNPNNGEEAFNSSWVTEMNSMRAVSPSVIMIGYVHMLANGDGSEPRSMESIIADILRYKGYILAGRRGGIFLDQAEDSISPAEYQDLYAYIRSVFGSDTVIAANCPGTFNARAGASIVVTFENSYKVWTTGDNASPMGPSFVAGSGARTAMMVHSCPTAVAMVDAIARGNARGCDYVYVADGVMPGAWNNIPSYIDAEVITVKNYK